MTILAHFCNSQGFYFLKLEILFEHWCILFILFYLLKHCPALHLRIYFTYLIVNFYNCFLHFYSTRYLFSSLFYYFFIVMFSIIILLRHTCEIVLEPTEV